MFVYGGKNMHDSLSDLCLFDLKTFTWIGPSLDLKELIGHWSMHTMNSYTDYKKSVKSKVVKSKMGIFLFGGRGRDNNIFNDLFFIESVKDKGIQVH